MLSNSVRALKHISAAVMLISTAGHQLLSCMVHANAGCELCVLNCQPCKCTMENFGSIQKQFSSTDYRQHCAQCKSAGISFTQRPILRFFAPQGRHVAPMGVKFDVEEGTEVPLLRAKFHPHRCNDKSVGPPKLKFLLRFDRNVEYKRPAGAYPLRDFHKICRV